MGGWSSYMFWFNVERGCGHIVVNLLYTVHTPHMIELNCALRVDRQVSQVCGLEDQSSIQADDTNGHNCSLINESEILWTSIVPRRV